MIVCLDANIVIYFVERNPLWEPKVAARMRALAAAGNSLAVSEASRLECLVGPLQSGDAAILADYQKFFALPGIQMLSVTTAVWERAAGIRANYRLHPLDAIHLATAVEYGCGSFLTNDPPLARCTDIMVEVLT